MKSRKMKNSKTSGTKVSGQGSRRNSRFEQSAECKKHYGQRNSARKTNSRKRMLCTDHSASKWGFEHSCCSKGTRCGFAHQFSHQIVDSENHRINNMIKHAVANNDSSAFSELDLNKEMIDHFTRRSKICRRFLSCYQKKQNGTLEKSDICPGGANCKGGICGDSPDYDFSKSLLLDWRDWQFGKPSGKGICLTNYGLVPLVVQKERKAKIEAERKARETKKAREREREEMIKILSDKGNFPVLGTGVSEDTSDSSNSWGKSKDWEEISNEANRIQQRFGEEIIIHKGKTYRYTLKKGQEMKIIHDRPHIVEPMYESKASLRVTGYPKLYNMSSITSDEDRKSHHLLVTKISQRQYDDDVECYSEEEYYEEEEEYYEEEEEYDDWEDILD